MLKTRKCLKVLANIKWLACRLSQNELANFYKYQNIRIHALTLTTTLWELHYIKQEAILTNLNEPFEAEVEELPYGTSAVVHS